MPPAARAHGWSMEPWNDLVAIVADELGSAAGAEAVTRARRLAADRDETGEVLADELWEVLAAQAPAAFIGTTRRCSGVGLAYRYARRRLPHLVTAVDLTPAERRLLRETRAIIRDWSGLRTWRRFRHVMFADDCLPLVATVALRERYSGGFAFTWHRDLSHTAIYPEARIREYRDDGSAVLVGVLLHEESHLAVGLTTDDLHGDSPLADAVYEAGARLTGYVGAFVAAGWKRPRRDDLVEYLDEVGLQDMRRYLALFGASVELPQLVRSVSDLAVAAAAGEGQLDAVARRVLTCRRPVDALRQALLTTA